MALRIYADHNVSAAVVQGLRQRDVDVLSAFDDRAHELDDPSLLHRAIRLARVLFTHDDDFLREARDWQVAKRPFPGILYVHQTKLAGGPLIDELELVAKGFEPEEVRNLVVYLPL